MPPLRSVDSLVKICTREVAGHLFSVISSWYKSSKSLNKSIGEPENIPAFDYSTCYEAKEGPNDARNESFLKILMEGEINVDEKDGSTSMTDKEDTETLEKNRSHEFNGRKRGLSPVPDNHLVDNSMCERLTKKLRDYIASEIPYNFHEDILSRLINLISQKVEFPKSQKQSQDLDFINSLGFMLRVSVSCLLTKAVASLDLTSVAHFVKRWKLHCLKEETIQDYKGRKGQRPFFDIFSYALDVTASGLQTLKKLKLPHFVHNSFIRKIGFLCPSLKILILRCSFDCRNPESTTYDISDLDVLYGYAFPVKCPDGDMIKLIGCKNLITLELPEYFKCANIDLTVTEMLHNMPDLQYLVGAPMINVTQYIDEGLDCSLKPTKLINFHHEVYSSDDDNDEMELDGPRHNLSLFSVTYPHVKEVYINNASHEDVLNILRKCTEADNISIDLEAEAYLRYFRNLMSLDIYYHRLDWQFLAKLSVSSPNLEHLTIACDGLLTSERDNPGIQFSSLRTLCLDELSRINTFTLLPLIGSCPALSNFLLSTEEDTLGIQEVLHEALPLLYNIQKFTYTISGYENKEPEENDTLPTTQFCRALISACPRLTYIGKLSNWNVSSVEFAALQDEVRARNWNLKIEE